MEPEAFINIVGPQFGRIQDSERIGTSIEVYADTEEIQNRCQMPPSRVGGGGATRKNSGVDGFVDYIKVRADLIATLR
jgi:hypothetical protein